MSGIFLYNSTTMQTLQGSKMSILGAATGSILAYFVTSLCTFFVEELTDITSLSARARNFLYLLHYIHIRNRIVRF